MTDLSGLTLVKLLRKQEYNKKIVGICDDTNYKLNDINTSPNNSLKLKIPSLKIILLRILINAFFFIKIKLIILRKYIIFHIARQF